MAFRTFPLIIISFIAFLAVGLGNLGLFVLFVGHALMVPIAVAITQLLTDFIFKRQNMPSYLYEVEASHVALLVPTGTYANTRVNVAPSYWMAQTLFLFGYLIANAVSILYIPTDSRLDPILISNRKSRAKTIIITSLFFAAVLTGLRYSTHTETPVGIVAAVLVGGFLGYGWYQVAAACGVAAADVFGVAQQMIPSGGNTDTPMTCVYAPKP